MKISVITITCRENPRLEDMARTLSGSLSRAGGVELEWIIVDERGRKPEAPENLAIKVVSPLPSPHRNAVDKVPAHNSARNAGLFAAISSNPDYVVFLNDCAIVTRGWVELVAAMAKEGLGFRCKAFVMHDMKIPADGVVTYRDHHDLLRPVPPKTVAGACWGAPMKAFDKIHGFDLAYDGEDKGHDLDAIIRMDRNGVKFATSERAFVIRLRRTATKTEISTRKEVFNGARNQRLVGELQADRDRVLPVLEAKPPASARPVAAPKATFAAPPAPRPAGDSVNPAPTPAPTVAVSRVETQDGD